MLLACDEEKVKSGKRALLASSAHYKQSLKTEVFITIGE